MFRQLFDTVPDAMIVVDGHGYIVQANPQTAKLFGFANAEDLQGLAVEELMPQKARLAHQSHRARYMQNPQIRPMNAGQELVGLRRDGQQIPLEIALSPIQTTEGQFFVASIRDISETQRARQALTRAKYDGFVAQMGQLALGSANLNAAIESIPQLVATALDVEGVAIVFAHPQLQVRAALGLPPELCKPSPWSLDALAPFGQLMISAQPLVLESFTNASLCRPDRAFAAAGFQCALMVPLIDLTQPMGGLVALAREPRIFDRDAVHFLQSVANLLAAAVQRRHTEEQLAHAQRLDALGQLTGGIAHDFNNLLTVVSGSLQLLELELTENSGAQNIINGALRTIGRGAELTRKLLAFGRRQTLMPQAIGPKPLLNELGAMLGRTLGKSVKVEITCPDDIPQVYTDPVQLDAALVNLALNARDAMPLGGVVHIAVRQQKLLENNETQEPKAGDYIVFTVTDKGVGMTPEVISRAFEPFFTTKESGKGSGLGLSMVYGFIRQSNGHLTVNSQVGKGTSIELYLPLTREKATAIKDHAAAISSTSKDREAILVVEDDPEVRNIAVAFLNSCGYIVHAVADAEEAQQLLATPTKIALLFSDINLGTGKNGIELAQEIQSIRPELAILLTSGREPVILNKDTQMTERFAFLQKPYRREELSAAVRRIIDNTYVSST